MHSLPHKRLTLLLYLYVDFAFFNLPKQNYRKIKKNFWNRNIKLLYIYIYICTLHATTWVKIAAFSDNFSAIWFNKSQKFTLSQFLCWVRAPYLSALEMLVFWGLWWGHLFRHLNFYIHLFGQNNRSAVGFFFCEASRERWNDGQITLYYWTL